MGSRRPIILASCLASVGTATALLALLLLLRPNLSPKLSRPPTPSNSATLNANSALGPTPTSTSIPPTASLRPSSTPLPFAKILVQSLNVREGPGITYPSLAKVHTGDTVIVQGAARGLSWIRIQLSSGTEGWISSSPDYILLETPPESLPAAFFRPPSSKIQAFTGIDLAGRLRVDNGTAKDAVVAFTLGSGWVAAAYIRAGEEFEITKVNCGDYHLFFTLGQSWDGSPLTQRSSISVLPIPSCFRDLEMR